MPRENERQKARALAQEKIIQSLYLRLCLCLRRGHFLQLNESSAVAGLKLLGGPTTSAKVTKF